MLLIKPDITPASRTRENNSSSWFWAL
ncbi:hypothetical protein AB1N83_010389 [Pleurotus pulmonarius]